MPAMPLTLACTAAAAVSLIVLIAAGPLLVQAAAIPTAGNEESAASARRPISANKAAIIEEFRLHKQLFRTEREESQVHRMWTRDDSQQANAYPSINPLAKLYDYDGVRMPLVMDGPGDVNLTQYYNMVPVPAADDESDTFPTLDAHHFRNRRDADCSSSTVKPIAPETIPVTQHGFPQDAGSISFYWAGKPRGEIIALVRHNTDRTVPNLYCSSDYGETYPLCHGITHPIVQVATASVGGNTWIFALPSYVSSEYATNQAFASAKGLFVSTDARNFKFYSGSHHFEYIIPHPVHGNELLAFIQDDDLVSYYVDDLFYVTGYGSASGSSGNRLSTKKLAEYVHKADWSTASDVPGSEHDVFITKYRTEPGAGESEIEPLDFIRVRNPNDASPQTTVLKEATYDFIEHDDFLFATGVPTSDGFNEKILYVSTDDGDSFQEAVFPYDAKHNNFKIVDASEGIVFAMVRHTITRVEGGKFVFRIDSPHAIAGNYSATKDLFTPFIPNGVRKGVIYPEIDNPTGCSAFGGVSAEARGNIVLLDRGDCYFTEKVENAEAAGAIGVVIVNYDENTYIRMAGQDGVELEIPTFLVAKSTGDKIRDTVRTTGATVKVSLIEEEVEEQRLRSTSNLFTSDASGVKYTLSLDQVVYIPSNEVGYTEYADVAKIDGQPGTYLASRFTPDGIETSITFNKGGAWREIPAPSNAECEDVEHCHLVVSLGASRSYATPLSSPLASGIILANAAVGHNTQPYFHVSRDGGVTWELVAKRPYRYMILDHGGLIVGAPSHEKSPSIIISSEIGVDGWTSVKVVDDDDPSASAYLQLTSEPGEATLVANVYFYDNEWYGNKFDFQSLFPRPCRLDDIGDPDGDYDLFVPGLPGARGRTCLLGREHHFIRRAPCRRCYNGLDHEDKFEQLEDEAPVTCECNVHDYACAPGFVRDALEDEREPCHYDVAYKIEIPCSSDEEYELVQSYQRVVGDVCEGGPHQSVYEAFVRVPCREAHASSNAKNATIAVAVVVAALLLIGGVLFYPRLKKKLACFSLPTGIPYRAVQQSQDDDSDSDDAVDNDGDDDLTVRPAAVTQDGATINDAFTRATLDNEDDDDAMLDADTEA